MGRFYYRPVDPGFAEFGAGLGYGMEQGVSNYYGQKERMAERKLRDEDAKRRQEAHDRDEMMAEMNLDLFLAEHEGGRNAPPRPAGMSDLNFGGVGMARQQSPGNILTRPVDLGGRPAQPGPVAKAAADPDFDRYMPVGPEGMGYITNPEWARKRNIREAEQAEQLRLTGIAQALVGAGKASTMDEGLSMAQMLEGGFDPQDLFQRPGTGRRPLDEEKEIITHRADETARNRPPASATGATGRPTVTVNQALAWLDEQYPAWKYDEAGNPVPDPDAPSPQERMELARRIAAGEDVRLPGEGPADAGDFDSMLSMGQGMWDEARGRARTGATPRLGPVNAPGAGVLQGPASTPSQRLTAADTTAISAWREQLTARGWELDPNDEELLAMLAEAGLEEDEIALILRGR